MQLYLIRHAESANNAIYSGTGRESDRVPDPEITETGHQQAQHLAEHLVHPQGDARQPSLVSQAPRAPDYALTHLYCSLMTRSILTAGYIAKACGLVSCAHPDIFERGGIYELDSDGVAKGAPGPDRRYFETRFPQLLLPEGLAEKGWYDRPVETDDEFIVRTRRAMQNVLGKHADTADRVAMVVHGDFIDQFVNELLGVARRQQNYSASWAANWATHNTSITRFDFEAGSQVVVYTNRLDHLPVDLVTW